MPKTNPNIEETDNSLNTWNKFVPTYLALINDFYSYKGTKEKIPVIFIEGKTEMDAYKGLGINELKNVDFFMANFYPYDDKGNDIALFGNTYKKADLNSEFYYDWFKEGSEELTKLKDDVECCKFVEEVGQLFNSNYKDANGKAYNFKNIEGFGFVDRDFKTVDEVEKMSYAYKMLSYTIAHDFETSLFFMGFPLLLSDGLKKEEEFVKKLTNLIEIIAKQGVLQSSSIKFEQKMKDEKQGTEEIRKTRFLLNYVTYYNFIPEKIDKDWKNRNKAIAVIDKVNAFSPNEKLEFDFNNYLEELPKKSEGFTFPYNIKNDNYKKFVEFFKKDETFKEFEFENETKNWLCGKKNKMLNVFRYSNGHFLWKMVFCWLKELNFSEKKDLTNKLMKNVANMQLEKNDPIKTYRIMLTEKK